MVQNSSSSVTICKFEKTKPVITRIIIIVLVIIAESLLGYYSLVINESLFSRFIFFLLSAGIISLLVIKGIRYILPADHYSSSDENESNL